jgi:dolichol-phosphate mannosyltransferase
MAAGIRGKEDQELALDRRVISLGATFLGRVLFPMVSDPISVFFYNQKECCDRWAVKTRNYKILLEVLGKGSWEKETEVPFEFVDRKTEPSQMKIRTILEYARQVLDITLFSLFNPENAARKEWKNFFKFRIISFLTCCIGMKYLHPIIMKFFQAQLTFILDRIIPPSAVHRWSH